MEVMSEHTDNALKKELDGVVDTSNRSSQQEQKKLMEDMVSQKGMKHELAEVKRDVGKNQTTTEMKPPLEVGPRRTCSVEESMLTDMEYRTEKNNKRALSKLKKLRKIIDTEDEHIHNQHP